MLNNDCLFLFINENNDSVNKLLEVISSIYLNGGALFYSFKINPGENLKESTDYIKFFFQNEETLVTLEDLDINLPLQEIPNFKIENIEIFKEQIVKRLNTGGAYKKYSGDLESLRIVIDEFYFSLFGNYINEVDVYYTSKAWGSWFGDIGFDATWLFHDKTHKKLHLFCITDID